MSMKVYCVLDATHYPIAIYRNLDNANKDVASRNRYWKVDNGNLCYVVVSAVLDMEEQHND